MDFFRSILSDDPEPETLPNNEQSNSNPHDFESPIHPETEIDEDENSNSNPNSSDNGGGETVAISGLWSFGDLVKTLTTKSESVFETYRRDLKEFGTGLKLESNLLREVASRAVKDLPEVSTSAIDGVIKSTAEIISQGKVSLLTSSDINDSEAFDKYKSNDSNNLRKYSRFDSQLNSIQNDVKTYCEEPEDIEEYKKWKLGFIIGKMKDEIEELVDEDSGSLTAIYYKLVPSKIEDGTFWFRYFYKVFKLKQQEDMRAKLVKRSLDIDYEEELSWDVDDDDDNEDENLHKNNVKEPEFESVSKIDEKVDVKVDFSKSSRSEDLLNSRTECHVSFPVPQHSRTIQEDLTRNDETLLREEEDLEWDEIEDLGDNDEKVSRGETVNKGELVNKKLSGNEDEEDLSWDIEDDDDDDSEPVKIGNK